MRIGIVTLPLEMNYGGILQNWALQQALKSLGHEPITIDAYQRFSTPHYVYNWVRSWSKRLMGKKAYLPRRYKGAVRSERTGRFIEKHITKTHVMWDYKRSVVIKYHLDALVVGSDQVWRRWYSRDHLEDMYLKFTDGLPVKRIAYAASFGIDKWEYTSEQTAACSPWAKQFDAISVREESGVALCCEHLGVEAQCVLDPTLLLTAEEYSAIVDDNWDKSKSYLAVYSLDITPVKKAFIEKLAEERELDVRYYSAGWTSKLTVEQWLAIFKNATMVVTDSFHGTVFSILFGKEFYTLCNPHRGNSRMLNLLDKLGIQNRMLSDTDPVEPADKEIDWQDVYSRLEVLRKESIEFLENALKD